MDSTKSFSRDNNKIYYFDNLKIGLTILVVFHHVIITYGASGGWYYIEKTSIISARIIMSMITASNQAFFMGLFFFLSSYFLDSSLNKKGIKNFLLDRLKRLGIPLVFYSIILSPSLNYMAEHYGKGQHNSFKEYMSGYHHWIDFGVLWFVAALLMFDLIFVLLKNKLTIISQKKFIFPSNQVILIFAVILGLITYLVRGYFPVGWTLFPFGFLIGNFPQYIIIFIVGIIAYRNDWLNSITLKIGKQWIIVALIFAAIILPLLYFIKMQTNSSDESIRGHFCWQSLLYAVWEQIAGVSFIVGLIGLTKYKLNGQSRLSNIMARSSYSVYIFHPLVLISLSLLVHTIPVEPFIKLLFIAPLTILCSYILSHLILKISFIKKII